MNKSTKKLLITLLLTVSLILISGCLEGNKTQIPAPQSTNPPTQTSSIAYTVGELNESPYGYSEAKITGKILNTIDVSTYTYVELGDDAGRTIWAAIPQTTVELGTEGTIEGSINTNFVSPTLGRTFDAIILSDGIQTTVRPTNAEILGNLDIYSNVVVSGTANQTMDASDYTYIELDDGTGLIWAAISQTDIAIGDDVTVSGDINKEFKSSTLNYTFPVLVLGTLVTDDDATTSAESSSLMPPSHPNF